MLRHERREAGLHGELGTAKEEPRRLEEALLAMIAGVGSALSEEMAAAKLSVDAVKQEEMHSSVVSRLERERHKADLLAAVVDEVYVAKVAQMKIKEASESSAQTTARKTVRKAIGTLLGCAP